MDTPAEFDAAWADQKVTAEAISLYRAIGAKRLEHLKLLMAQVAGGLFNDAEHAEVLEKIIADAEKAN